MWRFAHDTVNHNANLLLVKPQGKFNLIQKTWYIKYLDSILNFSTKL